MELQLRIGGDRVLWSCGGNDGALEIRAADLDGWAARYRRAVRAHNNDPLPELGREMLAAVGKGWSIGPWTQSEAPTLTVLSRPGVENEDLAQSLLLAPWELLADKTGFLARNETRLFNVARRIGDAGQPWEPVSRDFSLLFMAASPEGENELDYEGEESAILEATRAVTGAAARTYVVVEELGNRQAMGERLVYDGPFEAAHLSCHGTIHKDLGPVLALENETGGVEATTPVELLDAFGAGKPPLVFVSACLTAAHKDDGLPPDPGGKNGPDAGTNAELSESYVRRLVRAGVANVVGWEGSVLDTDATAFASEFYGALNRAWPVTSAAARARAELLRRNAADPRQGRDWHLARVYLDPAGGGALTAPKGERRKRPANEGAFLDDAKLVKVAPREAFVGRRREIQKVLRAFADEKPVLLHGMGNLGKSSLAARVASRMQRLKPVVLYERYDAPGVFQALLAAIPADGRETVKIRWQEAVGSADAHLGEALEAMLEGPLDAQPVLLIVDDLEREVLQTPSPGKADVEPNPEYRETLAAILRAFAAARTDSRLLITSRYRFALPDGGRDLASRLVDIQLRPMSDRERGKQWSAAARLARRAEVETDEAQADRFNRVRLEAQQAAAGNPGLQELLTRPLLAAEPEIAAVEAAIASVLHYRATGQVPDEENAAHEFFQRISIESYRDALTDAQRMALQACTLFSEGIPAPYTALRAAIAAARVSEAEPALERLLALGLLDDWGTASGQPHAAVNPLARPLVPALTEAALPRLASAAVPPLADAWRNRDGAFPRSLQGYEAARLALLGNADPETLADAATAAANWLFQDRHAAEPALAIIRPTLDRLRAVGAEPSIPLLRVAAKCAERVGDTMLQDQCLERGLMVPSPRREDRAFLLAESADRLTQRGDSDTAMLRLAEARDLFERLGDVRSKAVTMGKIADILQARGQLDEALRIRQEEQLPVFERLGDVRSKAVTMGKIADILRARGQLDEALRIRTEEELPVYERLGDVRSKAVTMGKIADILQARGQLDEALRIRQEEQLPVYERLGDVRSKAVTMGKIADILQARGQLDEALRIRQEEELPVYERLGDVRSKAVTMGKIADILQARGQLDEALTMHLGRLEAAESLHDIDSLGHIRFCCARIRLTRGDHDRGEIQTIHDELQEAFAVFKHLQRPDGIGAVGMLLAQVLAMGGRRDDALAVLREARAGFELLKRDDAVAQADRLAATIRGDGG